MKYCTRDEFAHFEFQEVHIGDFEVTDNMFHVLLDNVIILPENSANRDIRKMRCNNMELRLENPKIEVLLLEGYKIYDADGNLKEDNGDVEVARDKYQEVFESFVDGYIFSISLSQEENGKRYSFVIDDKEAEHTYTLEVLASGDVEEWDRFLNLD